MGPAAAAAPGPGAVSAVPGKAWKPAGVAAAGYAGAVAGAKRGTPPLGARPKERAVREK